MMMSGSGRVKEVKVTNEEVSRLMFDGVNLIFCSTLATFRFQSDVVIDGPHPIIGSTLPSLV